MVRGRPRLKALLRRQRNLFEVLGHRGVPRSLPVMAKVALGPEDQGDYLRIGSLPPIPIGYNDDPRPE